MLDREHPCSGCDKRKPGCQDNCEPMIKWLEKRHKVEYQMNDIEVYKRCKCKRMGWKKGYK